MADAKLTSLTSLSVPAASDVSYFVDVSDTTDDAAGSSRQLLAERLMGLAGVLPGGRLTTETAVPVSTSDRSSQATLYYTPYVSDYVRLYDGTRIKEYAFTERSLSLTGLLTNAKPHDVWLYDNSGTLTLEVLAWTDATTRATALAWQTGLGWVKNGSATRLYVGTIYASGTGTTEDTGGGTTTQVGGKRFVWNAYNQVPLWMAVKDTADSWTYTTAAWRTANGASGRNNSVEYVCGLPGTFVAAGAQAAGQNTLGATVGAGVGVDSTTVNSANNHGGVFSTAYGTILCRYRARSAIGYHYLQWLEYSDAIGTSTWFGDNGSSGLQTGLTAMVMG